MRSKKCGGLSVNAVETGRPTPSLNANSPREGGRPRGVPTCPASPFPSGADRIIGTTGNMTVPLVNQFAPLRLSAKSLRLSDSIQENS